MNKTLCDMFKTYREITKTKGEDSPEAMKYCSTMCIYLRKRNSTCQAEQEVAKNGWPTDLDFKGITNRVLLMKDMLHQLVAEDGLKSQNIVQLYLNKTLQELHLTQTKFSKLSGAKIPLTIVNVSRPG